MICVEIDVTRAACRTDLAIPRAWPGPYFAKALDRPASCSELALSVKHRFGRARSRTVIISRVQTFAAHLARPVFGFGFLVVVIFDLLR